MKEQLLYQIIPLLITFVIGVLVVIIKAIGEALVALIQTKKDEVIHKILQGKHEQEIETALEVWNIVDEHFRVSKVIGDTIQLKMDMFNDLLLKRIPGLKQEDIDHLRQAIAGEVNKGKQALESPADVIKIDIQNEVSKVDQELIKKMHNQIPPEVTV